MSESQLIGDRVRLSVEGGVAEVSLARPGKLNCLDFAMFQALDLAGQRVAADRSIRAVVLHGEGRAFSSGLDFAAFVAGGPELQDALLHQRIGPANLAQRVAWVWQEVPVPVIAALQGYVFGGGLQIAMGADIRYAHPGAQLSVMEIKWGLIPDMGLTRTLLPVVRPDVVKELMFTGRILSGTEALDMGLVTRLSDTPLDLARETAHQIAGRSPDAIRRGKDLVNRAADMTAHDAFALESDLQKELLGTHNQIEAVMANMQKRPPVFVDE